MARTKTLTENLIDALRGATPTALGDRLFVPALGKAYPKHYVRATIDRLVARTEWCEACEERHPEPRQSICAECEAEEERAMRYGRDDHDHRYDSARDEGWLR